MAIDLKNIDKKKAAVVGGAIFAGLIAVALTNGYINESVKSQAGSLGSVIGRQEAERLLKKVEALEEENKNIIDKMRQIASAAQQAQIREDVSERGPKEQPGLSSKTPSGKRAITVVIEKLSAVGGLIAPGDYVDIIGHLAVPVEVGDSPRRELVTVTLFQNVPILAIGSNTELGKKINVQNESAIAITFALNPQEAELLTFAQQHGHLQLVLRSPLDTQAYILPAATWNSLSEYIMTTQGMDIRVPQEEEPAPKPKQEVPKPKVEEPSPRYQPAP